MDHPKAEEIYGRSTRRWTEERHASYLTRLEESFVRRMLSFDSGGDLTFLRLSKWRCWLDDCAYDHGGDGHAAVTDQGVGGVTGMKDKQRKSYDDLQDLVVPQLGSSVSSDLIEDNNSNAEVTTRADAITTVKKRS